MLGALVPHSSAQELHPRIRSFGASEGLTNLVVTTMDQDDDGFLWLGGNWGIARFDGSGFVNFVHDPADPGSFPSGTVRELLWTDFGNLWIALQGLGVVVADPVAGEFRQYVADPADPSALPSPDVQSLFQDSRGRVWVGAREGLVSVFDSDVGAFTTFTVLPDGTPGDHRVSGFAEGPDGTIWAGTFGGTLHGIDPGTFAVEDLPIDFGGRPPVRLRPLYLHDDGVLWVPASGRGIARFDLERRTQLSWLASDGGPGSLSHDEVMNVSGGSDGSIWVATYGGGVHRYRPETGRFERIVHLGGEPRVSRILEAAGGSLWAATWGSGLFSFSLPLPGIRTYRPEEASGLRGRDVAYFFRPGAKDYLWIASYDDGVHRLDLETGALHLDEVQPFDASLSSPGFYRIVEATDGSVYVGTFGYGLWRRLPGEDSYSQVGGDVAPGTAIEALAVTEDGRVWVGTTGGLLVVDGPSAPAVAVRPAFMETDRQPRVSALTVGPDGRLFVGTSIGLAALDSGVEDATTVSGRWIAGGPERAETLLNYEVNDIAIASDGAVWAAYDRGIERIEETDDGRLVVTQPLAAERLPSYSVVDLEFDGRNRLWISTAGGLVNWTPETDEMRAFFESDGLPGENGSRGALLALDGQVFFGAQGGFSILDPDSIPPQGPAPHVALTQAHVVRANETRVDPLPSGDFEIDWGETALLLEFSVIDIAAPLPARYEYRLDERSDWVPLGGGRVVGLNRMPPGTYEVDVRARTVRGQTATLSAPVAVRVVPPWWMTNTARVGAVLGLVGVVVVVFRWRVGEVHRRNLVLQREVTDRRRAEAERDRFQEQFLQSQKLEAVGKLTGGVAHDFNNILTVVQANLDLLAAERPDDEEVQDRLGEALLATQRAASLTRGLLSFSRGQVLKPTHVDLRRTLDGQAEFMRRSLGEIHPIEVEVAPDLAPILVDDAHFQTAVLNLVINARDALPRGGEIRVTAENVQLSRDEARLLDLEAADEVFGESSRKSFVRVSVGDDGEGMPPDVLKRVVEPFFTTKDVGEGSGLGLSMVYGFVRQSGGLIRIESAVGEGTTISLYFPPA